MDPSLVKAIINKNEDFLRRHIVLSTTVIEKLKQMGVIGEFTKKQMMGNSNNSERQVTLLMTALKSRGIMSFQNFLNVLRMTLQSWIADNILDSVIETGEITSPNLTGKIISVRNIVNESFQNDVPSYKFQYRPVFLDESEYPAIPYVHVPLPRTAHYPAFDKDASERKEYPRRHSSSLHANLHEYNERDASDVSYRWRHGRVSPITQIPENLRDLQKVFESVTSSTTKSIAVLRQEELTIKGLLQQNLREQQELLSKQEALLEIKDKMKQINKSAAQLYKPQPDAEATKTRLRHLQRIPWTQSG